METLFGAHPFLSVMLVLWVLPWKGFALWKAAHKKQKWWFIIILVVNTMAVLDILYIYYLGDRFPLKPKKNPDHPES
ncbi:MAG: DUF5652 family protein [Patescibacteria group bacterium]